MADLDLGDCAVAGAQEQVTVCQQLHAVDALGEELVAWADTLEESALEVDLDDVASERAHEGTRIIGSNHNALVNSLNLAHGEVLEQDFLLSVVDVPDADTIVVDGDQLLIRVVEESDLIGNVHAYIVTADCFSALSFPDNELVVVLAAERRQVIFVVGERETLDQHLVHLQTVLQIQGIEVPDDDIGLKALIGLLATSNEFACV